MIRTNPMIAAALGEERALQRIQSRKEQAQDAKKKGKGKASKGPITTLETSILENTIIKLGSLLALGFGEAGGETIVQNLATSDADNDSTAINAMIPGSKVEAIYGLCEIRDFVIALEVLQTNVQVFVNQV